MGRRNRTWGQPRGMELTKIFPGFLPLPFPFINHRTCPPPYQMSNNFPLTNLTIFPSQSYMNEKDRNGELDKNAIQTLLHIKQAWETYSFGPVNPSWPLSIGRVLESFLNVKMQLESTEKNLEDAKREALDAR